MSWLVISFVFFLHLPYSAPVDRLSSGHKVSHLSGHNVHADALQFLCTVYICQRIGASPEVITTFMLVNHRARRQAVSTNCKDGDEHKIVQSVAKLATSHNSCTIQ